MLQKLIDVSVRSYKISVKGTSRSVDPTNVDRGNKKDMEVANPTEDMAFKIAERKRLT